MRLFSLSHADICFRWGKYCWASSLRPYVFTVVSRIGMGKKEIWKFIIQTAISILSAVLTALGATSCMGL